MNSAKLDLYKEFKAQYKAKADPELLDLPPIQYLTVEGKGAPAGDAFKDGTEALYAMAYTIKMNCKKNGPIGGGDPRDYVVCKLEGLWWSADERCFDFLDVPREEWLWKLLIRTPDFITQKDLEWAAEAALAKGKTESVRNVSFETIDEGPVVQALHVGPYAEETPLIRRMHETAQKVGKSFVGKHHEIYLSDPRRVEPEKLKTILRHPID